MLALWGMTALEARAVFCCILTALPSPFAFLMWRLHYASLPTSLPAQGSPDHRSVPKSSCLREDWRQGQKSGREDVERERPW